LSVALGACANPFATRPGTTEYPGSGSGPHAAATYVVNERDTVASVSQRFGVSEQSIIERNKLKGPPYALKVGQYLELPGAKFVADTGGGAAAAAGAATQAAAPNQPGGVKRESLAPPPGSKSEPPPPGAAAAASERRPATGQPTPLSPAAATTAVTTAATAAEAPAAPQHFVWPVNGKILTPYGTASGGQKNDGIDIAAAAGTPVKAADGGTVIYAGGDVAHLGNLLLIQHPGGYITAYGNNEELLVKKGETVKKGQAIAKAGDSGGAASPRVHFEVRRGGSKTIDPATVLPPQ
jgi:murein DD-endopeptidase MepM/ murein hydrolase activator NlpD